MAEPVGARRLTNLEGQRLQQIVRRGEHGSIRVRRAMIIMAVTVRERDSMQQVRIRIGVQGNLAERLAGC